MYPYSGWCSCRIYRDSYIYAINMTKYLLSTGKSTTQVEKYILDLFKLNLKIWPGDIPGLPKVGFDFILTDTKKDEIIDEVRYRVRTLVDRLKERFSNQKIDIEVSSIDLIDSERVSVVINVGDYSDETTVNLYNN
jgi:hypothetical protein